MSIFSVSPVSLPNICVGASISSPTFSMLTSPLDAILPEITPVATRGNRKITFTFDYQVRILIYYHTEEFDSAQALLQAVDENEFVRHTLVPYEGLGESTFYEANATRGATQMLQVFDRLSKKVSRKDSHACHRVGVWDLLTLS